jgi:uncharacterized protein (DUF849 family)
MEDTVYLSKGVLTPSNAALVRKARELLAIVGATPATPSEARRTLGLA